MINICLIIVLLPLLCALGIGLLGWAMNRQLVYMIAIGGIAISTLLSIYILFYDYLLDSYGISSNVWGLSYICDYSYIYC